MKYLNNKRYVMEPTLFTAYLLDKELEKLSHCFGFKELISYLCIFYIYTLYTAKKQKI